MRVAVRARPPALRAGLVWCALAMLFAGEAGAQAATPGQDVARVVITLAEQVRVDPGRRDPYNGRQYRVPAKFTRIVRQIAREYALVETVSWPIVSIGAHCVVFELTPPAQVDEVIASLLRDARIATAQRMNRFEVLAAAGGATDYDDPLLPLQAGMSQMQVAQAHRWADGNGVRVAVIDTAVDARHADLKRRVRASKDFVDNRRRPSAERHATAVAGVIAAEADNGVGIVGVAPDVELLALRACWEEGDGAAACDTVTLARALDYAILKRAAVINMSLAGPHDALLEQLVQIAVARGAIVVAAARLPLSLSFPASHAQVIGVVSSGANEVPTLPRMLRAPGHRVMTTVPGGGFDFSSGNSLAAAHVSGLAALLRQRAPRLDAASVYGLMHATSIVPGAPAGADARTAPVRAVSADAGDASGDASGGAVVNACRALAVAAGHAEPARLCPPPAAVALGPPSPSG